MTKREALKTMRGLGPLHKQLRLLTVRGCVVCAPDSHIIAEGSNWDEALSQLAAVPPDQLARLTRLRADDEYADEDESDDEDEREEQLEDDWRTLR